jgi:hypothetical protein
MRHREIFLAVLSIGWYLGIISLAGQDFVTGQQHCGFYTCEVTRVQRKTHKPENLWMKHVKGNGKGHPRTGHEGPEGE